MTIVGFEQLSNGDIEEYLPKSEQLAGETERRQMFLHMYNAYVDREIQLSREEMLDGHTIYEVLKSKIEKSPMPIAAKLKKSISLGGKYRFLCDLDDMFLHLVYERAKLSNRQNKVLLFDKTIIIQDHRKDVSATLLIPAYTRIDKKKLYKEEIISMHLKTVMSTLKETQIRQIYLVYPQHPEFKRNFSLKLLDELPLREDEYRVKVIPYSFSFCIQKQKKHFNSTGREKCQ